MTGQDFVKKIRPAGCALFLLLFIVFLVVCFTSGKSPIKDYTPPHDSDYYAQSDVTLGELKAELEANVFPLLSGVEKSEVADGVLKITVTEQEFFTVRSAILDYYDDDLFEFIEG